MPENAWSDDELRTFLLALRSGGPLLTGIHVDDDERARFRDEAMRRIVPVVAERALADIGAMVDPRGVAAIALEVAEDTTWRAKHTWLMVTDDPWGYLADLTARRIVKAYREAVRRRGDEKVLEGIAAASRRPAVVGRSGAEQGASDAATAVVVGTGCRAGGAAGRRMPRRQRRMPRR